MVIKAVEKGEKNILPELYKKFCSCPRMRKPHKAKY